MRKIRISKRLFQKFQNSLENYFSFHKGLKNLRFGVLREKGDRNPMKKGFDKFQSAYFYY